MAAVPTAVAGAARTGPVEPPPEDASAEKPAEKCADVAASEATPADAPGAGGSRDESPAPHRPSVGSRCAEPRPSEDGAAAETSRRDPGGEPNGERIAPPPRGLRTCRTLLDELTSGKE